MNTITRPNNNADIEDGENAITTDTSATGAALIQNAQHLSTVDENNGNINHNNNGGEGGNGGDNHNIQPVGMVAAPPEINGYGLALVFLCPALGGFLYGYDIGATSFVLNMVRSSRDHEKWWYGFKKWQQGLLISSLALGALIGSHIVLVYLSHTIGRRKEIRIAAMLYIIGAMLNVMSGTVFSVSDTWGNSGVGIGFVSLIAGRLFYGAGVGFIMHGAPTYMAEMTPSHVRGAVVSAKETVIVFGIVVGMLMGDLISDGPDNWSDLYGLSILGALPMLFLTFKIPRSKRWLLMKGYHEEAKESMKFVYQGEGVDDEFDRMAAAMGSICCRPNDCVSDESGDDDEVSVYSNMDGDPVIVEPHHPPSSARNKRGRNANDETPGIPSNPTSITMNTIQPAPSSLDDEPPSLWEREYRRVMLIGIGLLVFQQFSGQPSVLAYSRVLFDAAGWKGHTSVVTVIIMGVTSSFTVALVDRVGRKGLLASGCIIMACSILVLAYGFWGWDEDDDEKLSNLKKQAVLVSMFVYIAGYQVGFGPITWTVLSEIYPSEIRGTAMALSVEVNFLAKFLCQLLFPIIQDILGWGCTFLMFFCFIVISLIFILWKVPETKGLSLEEIQLRLKGLKSVPMEKPITRIGSHDSGDNSKKLDSPLLSQPVPLMSNRTSSRPRRDRSFQRGLNPIV